MAKISARGDSKRAEWKHADGCRMVLTTQGRLLRNYYKGDGLTMIGRGKGGRGGISPEVAERYAVRLGFERVQ